MTPYASIVVGMTQMMKRIGWRTGVATMGAALAVATVFGPAPVATSRLGASEVAGHATVSVADTITSRAVLSLGAATRGVSKAI